MCPCFLELHTHTDTQMHACIVYPRALYLGDTCEGHVSATHNRINWQMESSFLRVRKGHIELPWASASEDAPTRTLLWPSPTVTVELWNVSEGWHRPAWSSDLNVLYHGYNVLHDSWWKQCYFFQRLPHRLNKERWWLNPRGTVHSVKTKSNQRLLSPSHQPKVLNSIIQT